MPGAEHQVSCEHDACLGNSTPVSSEELGRDPRQQLDTTNTSLTLEKARLISSVEHDVLDIFADSYCNKHLIYSIVETFLVRLIPELSERGIRELMMERGL